MFIKGMILENFESFGEKAVLNGFDSSLTVISGDDIRAILDAISLVMGMPTSYFCTTNEITDFICQNEKNNVTYARITIIYDNSDFHKSPLDYQKFEEINVCRIIDVDEAKGGYFINNIKVARVAIEKFFNSAGININSPYFLLNEKMMSKVLDTNVSEILDIVRESPYARFLKEKLGEENAKLMVKLWEKIFQEYFLKQSQRLKEIMPLCNIERELDENINLYMGWHLCHAQRTSEDLANNIKQVSKKNENIQRILTESKRKISKLNEDIKSTLDAFQYEDFNEAKKLEVTLYSKYTQFAKEMAKLKKIRNLIFLEEEKINHLGKTLKEKEESLREKTLEEVALQSSFDKIEKELQKYEELITILEEKLYNLKQFPQMNKDELRSALLEYALNGEKEFQESISICKQQEDQIEQKRKKVKILVDKLIADTKYMSRKSTYDYLCNQLDEKLGKSDAETNWFTKATKELAARMQLIVITAAAKRESLISTDCYSERYPEIKGFVFNLIRIKDQKFASPIRVAAQNDFYSLIIETEEAALKFLEENQVQHTVIIQNNIQPTRINEDNIKIAEHLVGEDNVKAVLSLIEYDDHVKRAIEFIFGNILICKDFQQASLLASENLVDKACVTFDGKYWKKEQLEPPGLLKEITLLKEKIRILGEELEKMPSWSIEKKIDLLKTEIKSLEDQIENTKLKENQMTEEFLKIETLYNNIENNTNPQSLIMTRLNKANEKLRDLRKNRSDSQIQYLNQLSNNVTLKASIGNIIKQIELATEKYEGLKKIECDLWKISANVDFDIMQLTSTIYNKSKSFLNNQRVKPFHIKKKIIFRENTNLLIKLYQGMNEAHEKQREFDNIVAREMFLTLKLKGNEEYIDEGREFPDEEMETLQEKIDTLKRRKEMLKNSISGNNTSLTDYKEYEKNIREDIQRISTFIKIHQGGRRMLNPNFSSHRQKSKDFIDVFNTIFDILIPIYNYTILPIVGQHLVEEVEVTTRQELYELIELLRLTMTTSLLFTFLKCAGPPFHLVYNFDENFPPEISQKVIKVIKECFHGTQFIFFTSNKNLSSNAGVVFDTKNVDEVTVVEKRIKKI